MGAPLCRARILLNVSIPGEPKAQARHRWGRGRVYDPCSSDKDKFMWQLRAAVPALVPDVSSRIGIRVIVRTASKATDGDNYLKFYMDALSPRRARQRVPKKMRAQLTAAAFAVWGNDNQIDVIQLRVVRGVSTEALGVDILAWTVDDEDASLDD